MSQPDTDQLFKGRYRKDSTRLKYWDYGSNAAYFITICTKNRVNYFGEIVDHEMRLTEIGKVAVEEWHKTKELRQDMNIELGDFTVMPNHIHGIIIIGENQYNSKDAMYGVSTDPQPDQSIQDGKGKDAMHGVSAFGPQSKNLSSIIRGYKSSVTIQAKKLNPAFSWQPRYYDHIIRDDRAYENISNYIITNPARWHEDKFFEG
ncbi:MAG: hypothetical protein JXQ65_03240 [Candidatus Marinimicrobia bacterium]|nr:hypothetical protein [Candidatus Neomarinimicrobiota bacterium]